MSRPKPGFSLFMTALLIVALALMPQVVAGISDFIENEKPGTAPMQSVELALGADKTEMPGYMMRRLALEQRMTTIPIEPEQAAMTEEEAIAAAQNAMAVYIEANIFDWFDYSFCSAEAYLGIDPEDKSNNMIFWGVTFAAQADPYHYLFVHIDDETGKILYLSYETYGPDQFDYYYKENQLLMMEGFVDSFLRPLNLALGQLTEYENLVSSSAAEQKLTDDVTCVVYTYEDTEFGTIHVGFHISPKGLCVYFPGE